MAINPLPNPILRGVLPTTPPVLNSPSYTVPANTTTSARFEFTNTTTGVLDASVWVVPAADNAILASHMILSHALVIPGMRDDGGKTKFLKAGDRVYWQASGAGLNGYVSAMEEVIS